MPSDFALITTVPMALCIRVCTDFIISIFFEILKSGNVVYMVIFPYFCIIMRGWTHSVLYDTAKTLTHQKGNTMKKSTVLSILMALLMPLTAAADTYTSLWKQYDTALQKDHPKTALEVLSQIVGKATRERAYGHLLKAQLATAQQQCAISVDSLQPAIDRLRRCEQNAVQSGDKVLAAIYQSVLGTIYTDNWMGIDETGKLGKQYFKKSMSNPEALAEAYSTGYEPFVIDGTDSRYFYHDMLHVLGIRANDYRTMHDYYASRGKREGACLTAIELVKRARRQSDVGHVKKSNYIMSLDSLVREYSDLMPCAEVAIERYAYMANAEDVTAEEKMNYINYALMKWGAWPRMNILRNAQRRLTLPSFHASIGGELALPGVPRKVKVMALNNIGELRITVSRLDIDGTTTLDPSSDKDYARLRRHIVQNEQPITDVRRYVGLPAYKTVSDTLEIKGLRSGMYLVEMSTDNVSVPVDRQLLRVCDIYPVVEALPGNKYRMAVLNATSGVAVPGAKIDVVTDVDKHGKDIIRTYTCDSNGEAYITYAKSEPRSYRIYTDTERAFPFTPMSGHFHYYGNKADVVRTSLFTDRSIYRPGQTLHVAAMAYTYNNKVYKGEPKAGQSMTITLRDANHKEVASQQVQTDEYGMASADFVLPQGGMTGTYTLRSDFGNNSYTSVRVEEYKRPTFSVDIAKSTDKYAAGDTVRLKGMARSFAGVPVQNARVALRVVRRPAMFWRGMGVEMRQETVLNDTVQTTAAGEFEVKVPIVIPDTYDEHPRRYYMFDVAADVTDVAGETRHAEASLPYSDHPTILTCDIPEKSLRDSLRTITFAYRNNAGDPIDGNVTYYIDNNRYTCKANTPSKIAAEALTSARHSLMAICGTDTLRTAFTTFTLRDSKAPVETHDWFYQSAERFKDNMTPVFIQVGSSDSIQHVVYTLISGDKVIEDGRADLKNELRTRALMYKEEWGDGITLSVAWVKNGTAYKHTARIERPLPDTRLNLKWTTFRDRLTPGQRETWTLNITNPDGTPAKAQLMATMYDKSLDEIRRHNVRFSLPAFVSVPWLTWNGVNNRGLFAYSEMPMRILNERSLNLSRLTDFSIFCYGEVLKANVQSKQFNSRKMMAYDKSESRVLVGSVESAKAAETVDSEAMNEQTEDNGSAATEQIRENLNETAFFYPALVSDAKGNVSINFTLPESVTTWQFYGLAHDLNMNNGVISATSVAKKTIMVQPNMPRFVRSTDSGVLSARVSNTSDKQVAGTARLVLLNPETGKEVYRKERKYTVMAGETTAVDFDFDMSKIQNDGLLVCRITAHGHGYSDGEQHYLPVLPDNELVTNTYAFTQNAPGTLDIDVAKMFAVSDKNSRLTVEYTNSPSWLMVQALPTMSNADGDNAMSLATAYYANALGRHIMLSNPAIKQTVALWQKETGDAKDGSSMQSALQKNSELKQIVLDETPWLNEANRESEQKRMLAAFFDESQMDYRLANNLSLLSRLQLPNGSFAWWKGMEGSPSMTMAVVQTLVRLNAMIGEQANTNGMIAAAFSYMDKQIAREVKNMKKLESEGKQKNLRPSELAVQYLYASTLAKRQLNASAKQNFDWLISRLARQNTEFTIYGKAVSAVVLAKNNHRKEAANLLESIRQYTVYTDEMGRYFDSPKAQYSWFDYRIPSQVAAIEALKALQPDDVKTIGEMQRWLLQTKRTQAWDTPINSVNAVYAFLNGNGMALVDGNAQHATIKIDGQKLQMPKSTAGLGYVKAAKTGDRFKQLTVEKASEGTSWGAVYAQFMQQSDDVADAAMGMTVVREVLKDGNRMSGGNVQLNVGDRIMVRLTVTAARDYDFVQLSDRRAACLEPAQQLSGYGFGYYCQPKDNVTNFFFDRMSKGKHVIETIYYVDRKGEYHTGTCAVQCAYAPEFMARTKAVKIAVK